MAQVPAYSNGDANNGNSPPQQDYVVRSDKTEREHQRGAPGGPNLSGATQSSAKPKQQA
jgi:hypothetical protein